MEELRGSAVEITRTVAGGSVKLQSDESGIFTKAIAVLVKTSCLGVNRKLPKAMVDTKGADADWVKATKKILESKELEAIKSHLGETRRTIEALSTPSAMFRSGVYLVGIRLVPEADEYLVKQLAKLRTELVPAFVAKYEELMQLAKVKLGPAFNPADYPSIDSVANYFDLEWNYITIDKPAALEAIDASILQREQKKAAATWRSALDEATTVLRLGFKELVDHMVERLQPGEDGKKRIFRDSLVMNLREFLRTFPERNLANDEELNEFARQANQILGGLDAQQLRDNEGIKTAVAAQFQYIKTQLDAAVCAAPARKYSAEE